MDDAFVNQFIELGTDVAVAEINGHRSQGRVAVCG